jgi:hypothetical protein
MQLLLFSIHEVSPRNIKPYAFANSIPCSKVTYRFIINFFSPKIWLSVIDSLYVLSCLSTNLTGLFPGRVIILF